MSWRELGSAASFSSASTSDVGAEHVVAHRGERLVGRVDEAGRVGRLLEELVDRQAVGGGLDHAELPRLLARHPDARDRHARAAVDVRLHHLRGVHAVDVVGAEHHDDVGARVVDQVHRLVDRVGAAEVPLRSAPLLCRHRRDVVAEQRRHPPGDRDVPVQRVRLVLRQHGAPQVAGVDEVRQREVDEPVAAAERDGRLRPVERERHQPLALAAREHDPKNLLHVASRSLGPVTVTLGPRRRFVTMAADSSDLSVAILTREFPPDVYGGAGVHVDFLVRELRKLVEVDVQAMGEPREGAEAHTMTEDRLAGANAALQVLSTDIAMTAAVPDADVVHSHTWYANMAGHWAKLLYDVPHVVTAHSLEPQRPWKAEQLGGGYRLSSWAERTAYESADAVVAVSNGMRADILVVVPVARRGAAARGLQRHRHRLLPARPRHHRARADRRRPRPGPTSRSSAASPGRRGCRTCCGPASPSTRTCRSCCSRAPPTPRS